jgi:hypothetical protein
MKNRRKKNINCGQENHHDAPLRGDLSRNYILFNLLDYRNGREALARQAIEFAWIFPSSALLAYLWTYINNHI